MAEMKTVVVYDSEDINTVLKILNEETPITGIESMRNVVNAFDIIKHKGSIQQAEIASDNQETHGSVVGEPIQSPENAPRYMGEGGVMYDAEAEDLKEVEPAGPCPVEVSDSNTVNADSCPMDGDTIENNGVCRPVESDEVIPEEVIPTQEKTSGDEESTIEDAGTVQAKY